MLSQTPEITTPADESQPDFGAPFRTRYSTAGEPGYDVGGGSHRGAGVPRPVGRHRRVGAEPADKFLLDIPTPHRPTTLADSPPTYRAAFLTDDTPWSRPSTSDETPRYRASRAAEHLPRQRAADADPWQSDSTARQTHPTTPPPGAVAPSTAPTSRSRRHAAPGRRRAQQDSAWDKAAGAVQRAVVVRPLPISRDALADQSQAAWRVAGAVRDWTLADPPGRPVTGSRRAPGTLPIESWLLIGRHRQQALLAALVAVGIALVMIPTRPGPDDVTTVNAADRSVAAGPEGQAGSRRAGAPPADTADPAGPPDAGGRRVTPADRPAAQPTATPAPESNGGATPAQPAAVDRQPSADPADPAPADPAAPAPGQTASGVSPDAQGPAGSLRRTGSEAVALTFDDGPDPVQTPKLLQLLATHQVTATFCLVGERAQANPELVQQIAAAGHTLCNHSWSHSFTLGAQTPDVIRKDLEATDKAIRDAVPNAPIPYFRAPGGIFTDRLVSVAGEYEMSSLYWEVDPRDWDHTADADDAAHVERVVAQVKQEVKPGSIVLSHDFNQPQTIVAYEQLLPYLTEKYELGLP